MRVVLTDGEELTCTNFKALDSGVLLTKDKKRKKVVGYVPNHQLRYVADESVSVVSAEPSDAESASETESTPEEESETESLEDQDDGDGQDSREDSAGGTRTVDNAEDAPAEPTESDLQRLGGLGATYAERLHSAGYDSVAALAEADPVAVAEAASVAPGRGRRWVDAAVRMTEGADEGSEEQSESEDEVDDTEGNETAEDDAVEEDTAEDDATDGESH